MLILFKIEEIMIVSTMLTLKDTIVRSPTTLLGIKQMSKLEVTKQRLNHLQSALGQCLFN